MIEKMHWLALVLSITGLAICLSPNTASACGSHGTNSGNDIDDWLSPGVGADGRVEGFVVIEDDFIVPTAPTVCVCGIGLGSTTHPLSTNVQVVDAHVSILNVVTGSRFHLPEFEFAPDPDTEAGLEVGDRRDPATLPVFEGATWFGFSAVVDSFVLPTLGPDEVFVLGFDVTLPEEELPFVEITQFAAGEGDADGFPLFEGSHRVEYFVEDAPYSTLPEPGVAISATVGCLVLLALGRGRSKSRPRSS